MWHFLQVGIRDLLQENGFLVLRNDIMDLIPDILGQEREEVKSELEKVLLYKKNIPILYSLRIS